MAVSALSVGLDPAADSRFDFTTPSQPIVDAAFLCEGFLRSPNLWDDLAERERDRLLKALYRSRRIRPHFNNWLLFSAVIEAFLARFGDGWDRMRVDSALRQHLQWYRGDGIYGDGPIFHFDYYNSYVIHPMLLDIADAVGNELGLSAHLRNTLLRRSQRYAEILERLIAPDGSFPAVGRSLAYRAGSFHLLAELARRGLLPEPIRAGQARAALSAVIERCLGAPFTFTEEGFLQSGLCGAQPSLAENYISGASLYLTSTAFLPLGLAPNSPFWTEPDEDWTSKRVWHGGDVPADHALHEHDYANGSF
jgi:hypothetical protein